MKWKLFQKLFFRIVVLVLSFCACVVIISSLAGMSHDSQKMSLFL